MKKEEKKKYFALLSADHPVTVSPHTTSPVGSPVHKGKNNEKQLSSRGLTGLQIGINVS